MKSYSIHYETVARAFQVSDIATPISAHLPPDASLEHVRDTLAEVMAHNVDDCFCLIRDSEEIYGFFAFDDPVLFKSVLTDQASQRMSPIRPDQIVSQTLPLLDLIPLFRHHRFFFALTRNDVTHVVSFVDMDKLYLQLLPTRRLQKARDLCRAKYGTSITTTHLLMCTMFVDKATMLLRSPILFRRLPFSSKKAGEHFFKMAERLRNQIAHSNSILSVLKTPDKLDEFIMALRQTTDAVLILRGT